MEKIISRFRKYLEKTGPAFIFLIIFLVLWETIVRMFQVSPIVLPAPLQIFTQTSKNFIDDIMPHWLLTVRNLLAAYLLGAPTGIILASIISQSKLLTKALTPYIVLLVTLPMMVLVPIFLVWAGFDPRYRIILTFINVTAIVALNTMAGFKNVPQSRLDLAAGYGATKSQTFWKVIFPNALPEVFVGLRLGCTFSILNTIGIEFVAGKIGMGYAVQFYSNLLETSIAFGCIFIVGITGRLMFMMVEILQKRVITWRR
jgi:ABC-type nitrate/sulfonate/bicarbonate transport system permease component